MQEMDFLVIPMEAIALLLNLFLHGQTYVDSTYVGTLAF